MLDIFSGQDLNNWALALGYMGLMAIIFLETATFFGFVLPGDSLVFTAGLLASKDILHIGILIPLFVITAFLGYLVGYWFGDKLGSWLSERKDSFWFKKRYLAQAKKFYDRHGGKAVVFGRLIPFARTFVPIVAGMIGMSSKKYFYCNLAGALVWGAGVSLLGYFTGGFIPDVPNFLWIAITVVVFLTVVPVLIKLFKN